MRAYEPSGSDPRIGICLKTAQINVLSGLIKGKNDKELYEFGALS